MENDNNSEDSKIVMKTAWALTGIDFDSGEIQLSRIYVDNVGCLTFPKAFIMVPEVKTLKENRYYVGQGFRVTIESCKDFDRDI